MPLVRRRVTSPAALRALAHPTRLALLELLVEEGARTATEAAATLGETPANCSWHLRKLAEHGFVREAPGRGGRARPWRAVSEALAWGDVEEESTTTAGEALTDTLLERELQRLRAARAAAPAEDPAWREAATYRQARAWMTLTEAAELSQAIDELVARHAGRAADPSSRPAGSRLVSVVAWAVPSGPRRATTA